jgi:hypothetical protein
MLIMKKIMILMLIALIACGNSADTPPSTDPQPNPPVAPPIAPPATPPQTNLPDPAFNTAELILGGTRYTLIDNFQTCAFDGISLHSPNFNTQISIVSPDFFANGQVLLESNKGWQISFQGDIGSGDTIWEVADNCQGWAIGNEQNFFELQALNCPLKGVGDPNKTTIVTFRVRCAL